MQPCFSEDFHFVALCLKHQLAGAAQLKALFTRQANEPTKTLGDLLVEEGFLTPEQHQVILDRLIRVVEVEQALDPHSGREFAARFLSTPEEEDIHEARTLMSATISSDMKPMPPGIKTGSPAGASSHDSDSGMSSTPSRSEEETQVISQIFEKSNLESLDKISSGSPASAASEVGRSISASLDSFGGTGRAGSSISFTEVFRKSQTGADVIGSEIAGHVIEGHLGRGGQGQVYRARQLSLNRMVALKVLPLEMAQDVSFINRFISEARTLATFTHPNIVQVYDVGVTDGVFYFTMEAVQGQSLKDLLQSQERVPVDVGVNLMKQCLRGLDRAARAGIIHRDIKPGNILIDDEGILKLVDFGLAEKCDAEGILSSSQVVGTPLYISPEQIAGKDVSSKADQYSLGATFFHMLTGTAPFVAKSVKEVMRKHTHEERPDPCALVPEIHPELGKILQRMMAKTAAERYPSFQELFRVLEDFELRHGLIESRSSFLAEGLMNIGERSVRRLWTTVGLLSVLGIGLTAVAVGSSVIFDRLGWTRVKDVAGDLGAVLLFLAFAAIMYIAGVRKRLFPRYGNVKIWLETHIALALTGFFLSMVHSGNFLNFFRSYVIEDIGALGQSFHVVPWIPFLNSAVFTVVIISGLVGRYIWRDIARQIATEQIQRGLPKPEETHELTLAIFAQKGLRYWRIFHYPMAFALVTVTLVHIISIMYYGG